MSSQQHYFRIGIFVITAIALTIAVIIILGAGALFEDRVIVETYLNESVQGLDAGAHVKYRGVSIGNVKDICLVQKYYKTNLPYILVRMAIDPKAMGILRKEDFAEAVKKMTEQGMRIRWTAQGLTGVAFLELNYLNPEDFPVLPLDWTPMSIYIPSATSDITRFTSAIDAFFRRIEKANIEGIMTNLESLLDTTDKQVKEAGLASLREEAIKVMKDVGETNRRIQEILKNPAIDKIPNDAGETMAGIRRTQENLEEQLKGALAKIETVSKRAESIANAFDEMIKSGQAQRMLDNIARASDNISSASQEAPAIIARLERTAKRSDSLLASQRDRIDSLIDNLERIARNLEELSEKAKRYPSQILFGGPPARMEPGK
ncbi:MAG: MlaD family protein [Candidatus Sumerlaeota bacterium]|nr:MlaD family protein [Candidatus Sumerlaeota bacterium]